MWILAKAADNRAKKQRKKDRIRPQRKGVMERRTGAIEREKRDVAKGKLRIKTKTTVLWAGETQRALPPLRLTASSTSRIKVKRKHRRQTARITFETHEAGTTHQHHAASGCDLHDRSSVF